MTRLIRASNVQATLEPHRWIWAEENEDVIAAHWARRIAERPTLFNGRVLMLSGLEERNGVVAARFFETDYARMTAWLDLGRPGSGVTNGFAMGALRGEDGRFILGRMAQHTANAGQLYFPAGTPDPSDVTPDGEVDLAGSMLREITEETGLTANEWTVGSGWTLSESEGRMAFLRDVVLDCSAEEACLRIRRFLASERRPELADVEIVNPASEFGEGLPAYLRSFLANASAAQIG